MIPSYRLRIRRHGGRLLRAAATWLVAPGIAVVLVAGCDRGGPAASPTTSVPPAVTSSPSVTPSPSSAGALTALDAYRGMWKAYVEAIRIPDPVYPDLARYAHGDALKVFVNGLTSVQRDGLVGQGDVTLNPSVAAVNPNVTPGPTTEIKDCVDTSQSHLVKKDGSPYQDTPGGRRSVRATATRFADQTWKVTSVAVLAVGTC
jgi:hypothetical protein